MAEGPKKDLTLSTRTSGVRILEYRIKMSPDDKIIEIPDSQRIYEFMLTKISETGFDVKNIIEGRNFLQVSCAMPENTVLMPLMPMEFTRKIEKEDYPFLKMLKSIRFISEDILSRTETKSFFQTALDNLLENKWEIKDDILIRRYQDISFDMEESLEPIRLKTGDGYVTRIVPVFSGKDTVFQFFARTDIEAAENLLRPGSIMDFGFYSSFRIKEISYFERKRSNTGILLSKYCPVSLEDEIHVKKSYFRTSMTNGIQYIKEGSLLRIKRNFKGQVFVKDGSLFNGQGYLYYV